MAEFPLDLIVERTAPVAPGIVELALGDARGGRLPDYVPGSHLTLDCGDGLTNSYSLTGSGIAPQAYTLSVLDCPDGRGGSRRMHMLRVGNRIAASRPRSAFPPVLSARHHLLVAGGIGITPMLSHLRAARAWGRPATLLYAVRSSAPVPHLAEVSQLAGERLHLVRGREGVGRALTEMLAVQPPGTHLYVCGPGGLIDATLAQASALGWPRQRCHAERFGITAPAAGEPFVARLARSGRTLSVDADSSLLAALEKAGIAWPHLCRQGVCGECRMDGVTGMIDHRDHYLTPAERESGTCLMPCVSRARGTLVLNV